MDFEDILAPRFARVQFDTTKIRKSAKQETFDSDLEEDNVGDVAFGSMGSPELDNLFVMDTGGTQTSTDLKLPTTVLKATLTDMSPSLYIDMDAGKLKEKMKEIAAKSAEDVLMKKCVIPDDAEKFKTIDVAKSKRAQKRDRKQNRDKTAGSDWFDMAQAEMTDERQQDLEILKMRKVLDGKTFYKKNDMEALPKYFQVGTVVENATDFYSDRIPKKMRKQTLVDELMQDEQFKSQQKKKFREALERQQYTSRGALQKLKKLQAKEESRAKKVKTLT